MKRLLLLAAAVLTGTLAFSADITSFQDGDWSLGTTWVGGVVPGNGDNAIIDHHVIIDANDRCANVTINASGHLENDGNVLRVDGNWANNGTFTHGDGGRIDFRGNGFFTVTGDTRFYNVRVNRATLVLLVSSNVIVDNRLEIRNGNIGAFGGTITLFADDTYNGMLGRCDNGILTGNITFMRTVSRGNGWGMYGMPFDASLADYASTTGGNMIYSGFTGGENFPTFTWVNTYTFNETAATYNGGYTTPGSTGDIIPRGTGFWYYNTDQIFGGGSISYSQDWTWTMTGTVDLTSTFNFGVTYTDNGTPADDGWNLIANPYPGTLNWLSANWGKTNIDDAVYYFRSSNQATASYVGGVNTNGNNNNRIPAGNGFYVKANAAGPSLTCTGAVLMNNNRALRDGSELEEGEIDESAIPNLLKIELDGDEIAVRLTELATVNFDGSYDAYKFGGGLNNIYTKYGADTTTYSINSLPLDVTSVPLYTSKDGEFHIKGLESFMDNYTVTLEDKKYAQFHELGVDFAMDYIPEELGVVENRFVLHFAPITPTADVEELTSSEANIDLTYNVDYINASYSLPGNSSTNYSIITIDGKVLSTGRLSGEKGTIELPRSNSIRLFVVDYNGNKITKKIL